MPPPVRSVTIAIYSDVICPWCYLGKKRLEEGLRLAGVAEAQIAWLPFELNPSMPAAGMDRNSYLDAKFGPGKRQEIEGRLSAAAREDGLAFNWPGVRRTPNTRKAHILIALAAGQGKGHMAAGALMKAYFEQGRDIGQIEVLTDIAVGLGLVRRDCRPRRATRLSIAKSIDWSSNRRRSACRACRSSSSTTAMACPAPSQPQCGPSRCRR